MILVVILYFFAAIPAIFIWYFVTHPKPLELIDDTGVAATRETFVAEDPQQPWINSRLPNHFTPHQYRVELKPVLTPDSFGLYWFNGSSEVLFTLTKNTSTIVIHSSKLNYTHVGLSQHVSKSYLKKKNIFISVGLAARN